jgi:hypothetical protein
MSRTFVQILDEIDPGPMNQWRLCFQRVRYVMGSEAIADGHSALVDGYRFIWRRPNGSLQAAMGQACIPSLAAARRLMNEAEQRGWGHFDADSPAAAA